MYHLLLIIIKELPCRGALYCEGGRQDNNIEKKTVEMAHEAGDRRPGTWGEGESPLQTRKKKKEHGAIGKISIPNTKQQAELIQRTRHVQEEQIYLRQNAFHGGIQAEQLRKYLQRSKQKIQNAVTPCVVSPDQLVDLVKVLNLPLDALQLVVNAEVAPDADTCCQLLHERAYRFVLANRRRRLQCPDSTRPRS